MSEEQSFNLSIFTEVTKKVCGCCLLAIVLIILFVISPLSNFFKTSLIMKIVIIIILLYTVFLNYNQINILQTAYSNAKTQEILTQINMNLICSYIFTLFIVILIFFVIKSLFK